MYMYKNLTDWFILNVFFLYRCLGEEVEVEAEEVDFVEEEEEEVVEVVSGAEEVAEEAAEGALEGGGVEEEEGATMTRGLQNKSQVSSLQSNLSRAATQGKQQK